MPRKSFAHNLEHSTISLLPSQNAETKIIPKVMAQVAFTSVYFECDGDQHKPIMLFDGEIEAYSIMKGSDEDFFHKVKRVVFAPENRPKGIWRYEFNDRQVAEIASAGWFTRGSDTPPEFLSSSFALIVDNVQVDVLNPDNKDKNDAPILKVGPAANHIYTFDISDYELAPFIIENIREPQTEFETIFDAGLDRQNIAAQQAVEIRKENAIQDATPLTEQQRRVRNAVMDAEKYSQSIWDEIDEYRAANNEEYRREMDDFNSNIKQDLTRNSTSSSPLDDKAENNSLADFISQFESASDDVSASDEVVIKSAPILEDEDGNGIDDRVEAGVAAAEAIKAEDSNNSDDKLDAGNDFINGVKSKTDVNVVVETVYEKDLEDKDGNGIDDRVEAGVAAAENARTPDRYANTDDLNLNADGEVKKDLTYDA